MVSIKKLSNGITVVLEEMDYLRSVSFGVWVRVGSANETKYNNGISHMIEHMLFKGTKNRSAKKIAEDTAKIGGNMNAYTSKECTTYYVTTLDEHLLMAIDIVGDMIQNSLFEESDIEKEKSVIIEEIDMYEDSPEDMVHEMLQKEVWKDHPLGFIISGEKEIVNSYTKKELLEFKNRNYIAENIVISIAGHYKEDEVMRALEANFGEIPHRTIEAELTRPKYERCIYTSHRDIEQIHMNLAFDCIDYHSDEKYPLAIVNAFLGGSENSKLYQIIREELGYTYSIYSYSCSYEKAGLFHIDAALNPSKLTTVLKKIIQIIEELKKTGITEEELVQMKEQIKTELIIDSESTKNRMNNNGKSLLNHEKIISIDETISRVNLVTNEEIHGFMEKYLRIDNLSLSLVGNLSKINIENTKKLWESGNLNI